MDRTDRQIAQFVIMWAPFGWPPAEKTFVEFGMSSERLHRRCIEIIALAQRTRELAPDEKALVGELVSIMMRRRLDRLDRLVGRVA